MRVLFRMDQYARVAIRRYEINTAIFPLQVSRIGRMFESEVSLLRVEEIDASRCSIKIPAYPQELSVSLF